MQTSHAANASNTSIDAAHEGKDATLPHALDFTRQDLAANRQGALSIRQIKQVHRQTARDVARAGAVCAPAFIILALLFNSPHVDGILWALLLSGTPFVVNALRLWPAVQDANTGRVESRSGHVAGERWQPAWLRRIGRVRFLRVEPGYYFAVEGERFRVNRAAYLALEEGEATLYFTPRARRVVSIE